MASSQSSRAASSSEADDFASASSGAFCFKRKYSSQTVSESDDSEDAKSEDPVGASESVKTSAIKKKSRLSVADEAAEVGRTASSSSKSSIDFGLYVTKVSGLVEDNQSGQFTAYNLRDIISNHPSKLIESIQFNYLFEIDWLVAQYPKESRSAPLTLVHGNQGASKTDLDVEAMSHEHVNLVQARLDMPYGTHHSKLMILRYADGIRIVVHTANLIERDWHQKTQCGWLSPLLKPLPAEASSNDGDSPTNLRADLCRYLRRYRHPRVGRWADLIESYDCSGLRVFLIASCPGRHSADQLNEFGHLKLRQVLRQFDFGANSKDACLVGQFSSIGSLGSESSKWLTAEFMASFAAGGSPGGGGGGDGSALKLIYPTKDDVRQSLEGFPAGGSLPYRQSVAKQQPWLNRFLHSWSASRSSRSRAMPHMKSYLRYSGGSGSPRLSWYLVTSANLSKAAWGSLEKKGTQLAIRSYELGVLFVARQFGLPNFSLEAANAAACIPVPFDLPPCRYKATDKPWIVDLAYRDLPDTHGNIWCPPMCGN
ncbi:hypothetical protein BOX15_Mlig021690g1 [Macrostomum lignano]|uniref:Tyrosyl-DNA phosphodiesterase n=1 Tax=Macrostomum lignano TaxID=282301 RepID=A0A267EIG7_9PLAT|nr:hypothetical protein BOX15_Mlig021690g1 [Macrostomum lignano]